MENFVQNNGLLKLIVMLMLLSISKAMQVGIPVTDRDIEEHFTKYDESKDVLMPD